MMLRFVPGLLFAIALAGCSSATENEGLPKVAASADWAQWPAGAEVGEVSAVDVDSHGDVFVLHRPGRDWQEPFPTNPIAAPVVSVFDPSGKLVAQWGAGETVMPHGLSIAPDDSVWITDDQRQQLLHFAHDGTYKGEIGQRGVEGTDFFHFGRPTDIAVAPSGLYVADGYHNSRVVFLGTPQAQWGEAGNSDQGLAVPHSIAWQDGKLIVADRENSRIKFYTADGKLLRIIPVPGHPYAVKPLPDGRLVSVEGRDAANRDEAVLRLWSAEGKQLAAFDINPGGPARGHDLAIGPDGTIYIADVTGRRVLTVPLSELTKDH